MSTTATTPKKAKAPPRGQHGGHNRLDKSKSGESPPFTLRLGDARHAKLMQVSKERGIPASELMRRALDAVLL